MARSRKAWTPVVIWAAVLLASVGVLWFARYMAGGQLDRNDKVVGMIVGLGGLLVSSASLGVTILQLRRSPAPQVIDDADRISRAADTLAEAVRVQWEAEAAMRALHRPTPLQLHWLSTERPVAAPAATVIDRARGRAVRLRLHGQLDEISKAFLALPRHRLVVLGEPGAGKTVLAMLLTLNLLAHRQPGNTVPVLLSISSWDPESEHLHTWITRRLNEDYPALRDASAYGPDAAQRLVLSRRVIPILDGLDEVAPSMRATALSELNRAHADNPLVVTCRSEEFEKAITTGAEVLAAAAVVELQPATIAGVIAFIEATITSSDTRWRPVFTHIRDHPDGALAATLSSPLMVALARTIYAAPGSNPLTLVELSNSGGQAAVEHHLLDQFIPAVYKDQPLPPKVQRSAGLHRWEPTSAQRYLTFLATHLQHQNTRDLAWWDIQLAVPRHIPRVVIGLTNGILSAVAWGFALGLGPVALGVGLVIGLVSLVASPEPPARGHTQFRGRLGELFRMVFAEVGLGTIAGIALGLIFWLVTQDISAFVVLVLASVLLGVIGGFRRWLSKPSADLLAMTPQSVLRSDRALFLTTVLGSSLALGLLAALGFWLFFRGMLALYVGFAVGLLGGAGGTLAIYSLSSAWYWLTIAKVWLAIRSQLPWRLMAFLHDAHERGVFRQAGTIYQFRHARLQDHLLASLAERTNLSGTGGRS